MTTTNAHALEAAELLLRAVGKLNEAEGRFAQGAPSTMPFAETMGALHAVVAELIGSDSRAYTVCRTALDSGVTIARALEFLAADEGVRR